MGNVCSTWLVLPSMMVMVARCLIGDINFVVEQVHINAVGKLSSRHLGNVLVRSSVRHHQN